MPDGVPKNSEVPLHHDYMQAPLTNRLDSLNATPQSTREHRQSTMSW